MTLDLDDTGGVRELALHRIKTAREDLEAARMNFENGHTERLITERIMRYSEQYRRVLHWNLKLISNMDR